MRVAPSRGISPRTSWPVRGKEVMTMKAMLRYAHYAQLVVATLSLGTGNN
jgi:hypothetical protein